MWESKNNFRQATKRKRPRQYEAAIQTAYFNSIRLMAKYYPQLEFIYASANGGARDIITAVNLKRQGVLRGVWDVFVPCSGADWADKKYNGLYIEFKHGNNTLTPEQEAFRAYCDRFAQYDFYVAYSAADALKHTAQYLGIKVPGL